MEIQVSALGLLIFIFTYHCLVGSQWCRKHSENTRWILSAKRICEFLTATKQDLILKFIFTTEFNGFKSIIPWLLLQEN